MNRRRWQITIICILLLYLIAAAMMAWPGQDSAPEPLGTAVRVMPSATEVARLRQTPNPTARILLRSPTVVSEPVITEAAPTALPTDTRQPATSTAAAAPAAAATSTPKPTEVRPSQTPTGEPTSTGAPTATVTPNATLRASATPVIHVVAKGEVLSAIAKRHGVSVSAIAAANSLTNPDALKIGQVLVIPPLPTPSPTPS